MSSWSSLLEDLPKSWVTASKVKGRGYHSRPPTSLAACFRLELPPIVMPGSSQRSAACLLLHGLTTDRRRRQPSKIRLRGESLRGASSASWEEDECELSFFFFCSSLIKANDGLSRSLYAHHRQTAGCNELLSGTWRISRKQAAGLVAAVLIAVKINLFETKHRERNQPSVLVHIHVGISKNCCFFLRGSTFQEEKEKWLSVCQNQSFWERKKKQTTDKVKICTKKKSALLFTCIKTSRALGLEPCVFAACFQEHCLFMQPNLPSYSRQTADRASTLDTLHVLVAVVELPLPPSSYLPFSHLQNVFFSSEQCNVSRLRQLFLWRALNILWQPAGTGRMWTRLFCKPSVCVGTFFFFFF